MVSGSYFMAGETAAVRPLSGPTSFVWMLMDPGYMVLVAPLMKPKVCDLRPHPQEERTRECHLCLHLMEGCHWHRKPEQSLRQTIEYVSVDRLRTVLRADCRHIKRQAIWMFWVDHDGNPAALARRLRIDRL